MSLMEKLQAKLELYRLEQRYTKREKRTTFYCDAQYVDGEYVYASSPTSTTSSSTQKSRKSHKGLGVSIKELTRACRS
ncbi:hypothetical protein GQ43DRAFT_370903 [Delitschia confertaspora ATCC 74209]|uniref:Uncharacterized protein n=1 Tax=Delitschia confertaspora ATCC 74209 TaxID=1513339 RepID=A0A9P4MQD8_9PLEO|nr:hypothetical protein GQ43DRAFT_370903 [Delitschia confertaspora ATCC 74209]